MKKLNKISGILLTAITLTAVIGSSLLASITGVENVKAAEVWPSSIDTVSQGAIVMDVDSGAILYEKNINNEYYPASITKVLTTLLAIENCSLDETVTFSSDAVFKNEGNTSHIGRDLNEQMTMEQCLYAVMLESANECAYAVAEHVGGGDINKFIDMMNEKAKELGCKNTHFANPNGLPNPDHYTSCYDMALISRAAYNNKTFAKIAGTKSYSIPPTNKHAEVTPLNNHHAMLNFYQTNKYLYDPCVGGKTGYTDISGATLVTFAKKDGMTLVCVTMNAPQPAHYEDTTNLLNYCFDNFVAYNTKDSLNSFLGTISTKLGQLNRDNKYITVSENGTVILPRTAEFSDAKVQLVPTKDAKGNVVGQLKYTYADRMVGSADLIFNTDEKVPYPFHNIDPENGGSSIKYLRFDFKMILIIIVVIAAIYGLYQLYKHQSGKVFKFKKRKIDTKVKRRKPTHPVIKNQDRKRRNRRRNKRW